MRTIINVTQELIDTGERGDCGKCAIALAVLRLPGVCHVDADGGRIRAYRGDGVMCIAHTPSEAVDFMERYDSNEHVEPFTFAVEFEERNYITAAPAAEGSVADA